MFIVIGIDYSFKWSQIAVYNKESDNFFFRSYKDIGLQILISDLKNEYKEKLTKILVSTCDNDPERKNFVEESSINFLSEIDFDFNDYLSAKLDIGTKILKFSSCRHSQLLCVLYDVTSMRENIFETKGIKWTDIRFNVANINEMLIQVSDGNFNETHVIFCKETFRNNIFVEKIMQEKGRFCSFTVNDFNFEDKAYKAMIMGRYLLKDADVQSLVKLNAVNLFCNPKLINPYWNINKKLSSPRPINTYKSQTKLMGIDLGASRCVVCISRNEKAEVVKIDQEYAMPTVISFSEEKPIIGKVAMRHLRKRTTSVLFDFKSILHEKPWQFPRNAAREQPFDLAVTERNLNFFIYSEGERKTCSLIEIYQILLENLKNEATKFQLDLNDGESVNQAVITVPNFENEPMLTNICEAAHLTGIEIIDIIEEIHADLLYFLSKYEIQSGQSVVIVDIGGGTGFMQKFIIDHGSEKKIISQTKHEFVFINGKEIDQLLMQELFHYYGKSVTTPIGIMEKSQILVENEEIKEALSFEAKIDLDLSTTFTKHLEYSPTLTRKWFEKEVMEKLFRFENDNEKMDHYIADISRDPEPSKIFLFGGTCRIPYIQNYFKSIFEEDKIVVPDKLQEITAIGALIHGLQILNGKIELAFYGSALPTETKKIVIPKNIQHITASGALIRELEVLDGETEPAFQNLNLLPEVSDRFGKEAL